MPGEIRAASFADLYRAHAGEVYRYALYLSGDSALAQDITSETFLRVWVVDQPARLESVRSWFFVIARNVYRHEWRHLRRKASLNPAMPAADAVAVSVEERETLANAFAAMRSLPEVDRSALLLRIVEGFPYKKIAATLHISLAAAKVKVHRARLRLISQRVQGVPNECIGRRHS